MSEQEHIDLLLERYLLGEMSAEERGDFEKKLANDPELVQQLREEEMVHQMVTLDHRQKLKERIARVMDEEKGKRKRPFWRYFTYLAVAAAVALLAVVFLPRLAGPSEPEQLYAEYYSPLENMVTTMDGNPQSAKDLTAAMAFYDKGEFGKAIPLLESYPDSMADWQLARLYLGISYLEAGRTAEAKDVFGGIVAGKHPFYEEYGLWYLGLAELRLGDVDGCKGRMRELVAGVASGKYGRQAKGLLGELE